MNYHVLNLDSACVHRQMAMTQARLGEVEKEPALAESLSSVPSSCHTALDPA